MKVYDINAPVPQGPAKRDQQAFLIAISFHESALRALEVATAPSGKPISAVCPAIVAYAFAAELYLKSLAAVGTGTGPVKGHKLGLLYGRLDQEVKLEIATRYQRRTGRDATALGADLRAFGDAFQEWRYIFEGDGLQVRINLLVAFTQSAYETGRVLFPDWEVDVWQDERFRATAEKPSMTVMNLGGGTFLHLVDGTGGMLHTPEA
ncbi:hypothetical protein [Caulobacter soli]|uniref:hypothetical protein n=1 Tax=Caulobacter soli TaxID=2708539 RepID=UPI0013EB8D68|nr:hypothetical protein [Caulobacter soli]